MTNHQFSVGLVVLGIAIALYFRRAIFRAIFGIFSLILLLVILAVCGLIVKTVYAYSGLTVAIITGIALFWILYLLGRNSGGYSQGNQSGWDDDSERDRYDRDRQLEEDRRLQSVHDDARQRNPW
jgi:hypothetical protein